MCLIVDANLLSLVFCENPNDDFRPIREWVDSEGKLAVGGHLLVEYGKITNLLSYILSLSKAGKARIIPSNVVNNEEKLVTNQCKSDDPHVIALARVSGARILCSHDKTLHTDFRNSDLIDDPRGHIYQNATHTHLLDDYGHTEACKKSMSGLGI
jgi:hypothetical protein